MFNRSEKLLAHYTQITLYPVCIHALDTIEQHRKQNNKVSIQYDWQKRTVVQLRIAICRNSVYNTQNGAAVPALDYYNENA